ncbi:MAG: DUF1326 domain-containing protein [Candidatus Rokubacteria bacterium]|nr:DUF1326 domain-containing protein [Candidatus Rokubacteria bacterium]
MAIPSWSFTADYVESCNCDHGCPCNFNGFPTYGSCQALVLNSIRKGHYGDVPLDGLDVINAAYWPKAIHEGNGTVQLYIDERANPKQREAILQIWSGQAKGSGPFALFASTFKYVLDPQFAKIEKKIDGRKSWFRVPGVLEASLTPFVGPVDGKEQDVKIQLANGFIWKWAEVCKTTVMNILTPHLNFNHAGKNAFYSVVEYSGP